MSRRSPGTGLSLLRAAVADARREELHRTARSALMGYDPFDRAAAHHAVASTARVPAVVPAPAAAEHDDGLAAPEGETAVAIRLVERAQAGDADAFGELYDRYVDQVYRYIAYRVGSSQLAEDLTSETFLRALRRIGSFTWQGRDVGAWFVTIARNLIADHYKSGRYRLELTTDDVSESAGSVGKAPTISGPEAEVLEAMQNKVLLEAIKKLNAEQQECIVLRFLQSLSVSETAQIMGKNEGAIKALQYRAIRTLGRLLPEGVEL
ncbi:MAG: polymerase sigma-70 factor, subfamily [Frankiales bacterium]|jgi:RNA polymerase sigma-70 factor (ECF subfamily)|nr:polymerase sigma-70 factor, subfamily [Frankiales bacterium]